MWKTHVRSRGYTGAHRISNEIIQEEHDVQSVVKIAKWYKKMEAHVERMASERIPSLAMNYYQWEEKEVPVYWGWDKT